MDWFVGWGVGGWVTAAAAGIAASKEDSDNWVAKAAQQKICPPSAAEDERATHYTAVR